MNIKKIFTIIVVLVMIVSFGACNKAQEDPQILPTMAPEQQTETSDDIQTEVTAEPTKAVDPLAALEYWKVDPDKKVYNILLLGLDQLEGTTWARNDTTMILQVNLNTNTMKLVSFMRDLWVDIPGQGEYRLNNAYYRGGPDLAVRTVESVFDVDIDNYAVVNFVTFESLMRIVGTIVIDVKDYEVESLKQFKGVVPIDGEQVGGTITGEGENFLNYYQALSYARDRHSSGENNERAGDYGRNERQREVIMSAWKSVKSKPISLIPASVFLAMPYAQTDMSEAMIITLIKLMIESDATIEDMAIPKDGKYWSAWVTKDRSAKYTNDEIEALYAQKKAEFDEQHAASEATATGEDATATTTAETESFPSYKSWLSQNEFSNVIDWSKNSNVSALHEFLGVD